MDRLFAVVFSGFLTGSALLVSDCARAQAGRLDAQYSASLAGITLGKGTWTVEINEDQYNSAVTGATTGLLKVFSSGQGQAGARGTVAGNGVLAPSSYYATIVADKKIEQIRLILAAGNIKEVTIDPPTPPHPERIPLTEAALRSVSDPLSSSLIKVGGNGDPLSPEACKAKSAVFDGRMRYDLALTFKRMEHAKIEGYQGPVVVCAVSFTPLAGYIPGRPAIKYLEEQRDIEVWLAPIAGTRVVVPLRIAAPTPLGTAALDATRFVTVLQPHPTATSAKSQ
jgi:hypothetical protein